MASSWSCAARAPLRSRAALECTGDLFRCWGLRREAARARPQLVRRPARRRPRDDRKPEALRCPGDAGGREWYTRRRYVPWRGGRRSLEPSVFQTLALSAAQLLLLQRLVTHRSRRSQTPGRGRLNNCTSLHQRHRRAKQLHRCIAEPAKLQPWRTRSHHSSRKNVPRNRRPRRNAPTSRRSTVCKPPLAAL